MYDNNIETFFIQKADYYDNRLKEFYNYRSVVHSELKILLFFSDISIFSLLFCYDLWISICDFHRATKLYQKNYYCRLMYLLISEYIEDIGKQLGSLEFKILLDTINDQTLKEDILIVKKEINKFGEQNKKEFISIRNSTIGHREHKIDLLTQKYNEINYDNICKLSLQYINIIEKLHIEFNKIIKYTSHDFNILGSKEKIIEKYGNN